LSKLKVIIAAVIAVIIGALLWIYREAIASFFKGLSAKITGKLSQALVPGGTGANVVGSGLANVPVGSAILNTTVNGSIMTVSGTIGPVGNDIIQIVVGQDGKAIACIYNGVPMAQNQPISAQVTLKSQSPVYAALAMEYGEEQAEQDFNSGILKPVQIA